MKHNWGRCIFVFAAILLQLCYPAICLETASSGMVPKGIANLRFFQQAYPDISFQRSYDTTVGDWLITLVIPEKNDKKRRSYDFRTRVFDFNYRNLCTNKNSKY